MLPSRRWLLQELSSSDPHSQLVSSLDQMPLLDCLPAPSSLVSRLPSQPQTPVVLGTTPRRRSRSADPRGERSWPPESTKPWRPARRDSPSSHNPDKELTALFKRPRATMTSSSSSNVARLSETSTLPPLLVTRSEIPSRIPLVQPSTS